MVNRKYTFDKQRVRPQLGTEQCEEKPVGTSQNEYYRTIRLEGKNWWQ